MTQIAQQVKNLPAGAGDAGDAGDASGIQSLNPGLGTEVA